MSTFVFADEEVGCGGISISAFQPTEIYEKLLTPLVPAIAIQATDPLGRAVLHGMIDARTYPSFVRRR